MQQMRVVCTGFSSITFTLPLPLYAPGIFAQWYWESVASFGTDIDSQPQPANRMLPDFLGVSRVDNAI